MILSRNRKRLALVAAGAFAVGIVGYAFDAADARRGGGGGRGGGNHAHNFKRGGGGGGGGGHHGNRHNHYNRDHWHRNYNYYGRWGAGAVAAGVTAAARGSVV
jgi:hypothetical protein